MSRQVVQPIQKPGSQEPENTNRDHKQIEALAYQLWLSRGRPEGSPDEDWFRAEEQLRRATEPMRSAA